MRKPAPAAIPALPVPVQASDLIPPSYKATGRNAQAYEGEGYRQERLMFDLWHTARFGWCIPTLQIRHAGAAIRSRNAGITQDRTYAVEVSTGRVTRIGFGPHVTAQVTVYVTERRREALQPLLNLRTKGQADAGDIRDRISTRRAQTALRRTDAFGGIFRGIF